MVGGLFISLSNCRLGPLSTDYCPIHLAHHYQHYILSNSLYLQQIGTWLALVSNFTEIPSSLALLLAGGSYVNSCTGVQYDNTTQILGASCNTGASGDYGYAQVYLNMSFCTTTSTVENNHGTLQCSEYIASSLPSGSWQNSCGPYSYSQGWLSAYCSNGANPVYTFIEPSACSAGSSISNSYGYLVCWKKVVDAWGQHQPATTSVAADCYIYTHWITGFLKQW
jgi:hypothetical protein